MKVIVGCEFSGVVRDAFRALGHDAWSCDLLPSTDSRFHHQGDILQLLALTDWDLLIGHPDCTYLTKTGARWMGHPKHPNREKLRSDAVKFFLALWTSGVPKIAIENPVGYISTVFRKADQIIEPFQFGHNTTKATCLWLKSLPPLTPTSIVTPKFGPVGKKGKRMSDWYYSTSCLPSAKRKAARSITFQGIADAMAKQWGNL